LTLGDVEAEPVERRRDCLEAATLESVVHLQKERQKEKQKEGQKENVRR
jgi:hypothetical protein